VSLVYTDIRVNNLFRKYAATRVINLFNQKQQVGIYTNKTGWLKLNLALLSITSPQCGTNVTWIKLTLLSRDVAV